ncbi:hypothetical protein BU24DRAFT_489229 [Aaosphaeria arxii CBS 175.79]|uniref:DUF4470 domain-containing protein n=1 Tax=Aaosphaeria arxii CBS 175.79 TaxID=1450172 RepID=A0A6A5Y0Z6_9PLEO|nr:uncharacterized protein BU24DRAFT_489229 [Aaosphaeria arxii CBS 175.79]KAF2019225.1 hypothetical protein BU24DRAFT_489229 [Aaosphaeria arxii CBS 175.79]
MDGTASLNNETPGDRARKRGNELFLSRDYRAAIKEYQKAADLAPEDYRPWWNMSAAHFELGHYEPATASAQKALHLPQLLDEAAKQKIRVRLAKAYLYLKNHQEARIVIKSMPAGDDQQELERAANEAEKSEVAFKHCWAAKERSVRRLPHYKPLIRDVPIFFSMGHDQATALYDPLLLGLAEKGETLAYLFGGIGDARNLFQTLVPIPWLEHASKRKHSFHFTINDIKPEVFARDLLFFILLDEVANEIPPKYLKIKPGEKNKEVDDLELSFTATRNLTTIFYAYAAQLMPPNVWEHLLATIQVAIDALQDSKDYPTMIAVLESWRTDVPATYSVHDFLQSRNTRLRTQMDFAQRFGMQVTDFQMPSPEGCEADITDYRASGFLKPPKEMMTPDLQEILDSEYRSPGLKKHVADQWKINSTLVDLQYLRQGGIDLDPGNDVAEIEDGLYGATMWRAPKNSSKIYDLVYHFFVSVAKGLAQIRERLVVEAISGDITEVIEGIRFGLLKERNTTFPRKYDRIHLSNIPDYTGGSLFKYVHALPLLKEKFSSFVCSTNLRNGTKFPTREHFDNECALISDVITVERVFRATANRIERLESVLIPDMDKATPGAGPETPFVGWKYWAVQPSHRSRELPKLISRSDMENWVYGLFMKIVLATHSPDNNDIEQIYSPLNISILFRILHTVWSTKYPAHWLADILATILNNQVRTTARPARSYPLSIKQTEKTFSPRFTYNDEEIQIGKKFPSKYMDLSPFLAEFRTLATLWLAELPFGLTVPASLPSPNDINQYSAVLTSQSWRGETKAPAFVLLLAKSSAHAALRRNHARSDGNLDYRAALLPDEKGLKGEDVDEFRRNCAVITVWQWSMNKKQAKFWLDSKEVERMKEDDWEIMVLRTDNWQTCTTPEKLHEKLRKEDEWTGLDG